MEAWVYNPAQGKLGAPLQAASFRLKVGDNFLCANTGPCEEVVLQKFIDNTQEHAQEASHYEHSGRASVDSTITLTLHLKINQNPVKPKMAVIFLPSTYSRIQTTRLFVERARSACSLGDSVSAEKGTCVFNLIRTNDLPPPPSPPVNQQPS